jgi:hypothetical protein
MREVASARRGVDAVVLSTKGMKDTSGGGGGKVVEVKV